MPGTEINLQKVIVHRVDHKGADQPLLSGLESPITNEVGDFLSEHISNNREHGLARNGSFQEVPDGKVDIKGVCDDLLATPARFVERSQDIARHLFDSVKNDQRISTGDLVVCTFSEGRSQARWLALLKMDAQDSFVGHPEEVNGQLRIVLQLVKDVLPVAELQKCAFILPSRLRSARRDLIVLDQQTARYGARRVVSSFFSTAFLQCRVELNQLETTKTFYLSSFDWLEGKRQLWPQQEVRRFEEAVKNSLQSQEINVPVIAQAAIRRPADRDEYIDHVKQKLEVEELAGLVFAPDPTYQYRIDYVQFEGDAGLRIKIRADEIGPNRTLQEEFDEATNIHRITIRTTNLKRSMQRGR